MPDIIIAPQTTLVTVSQTGTQGPPGPAGSVGPQGPAGISSLFLMNDVTITGPVNNQFLKYNGSTWTNVNTETIDGGNW
jgi:hypothetical protein